MRAAALLAVAVLALAGLAGCSAEQDEQAPAADAVPIADIGKGDLCAQLTAGVLEDLTGETFEKSEVVPPAEEYAGRADSCFAASPDSGIAVTVDVWSQHKDDLAADILQFGSPAATGETRKATVAGHDAMTAATDLEGRMMADLAIDVDDRLLLVLVQRFSSAADGTTPEDQLDLAKQIAERLLPQG